MMDVMHELNQVFKDVFDRPELVIHENTTASDVAGWDSIQHISLVIAVEEHFNVRLSTADVTKLKNVGDMIQLIKGKLAKKT